jgi:hypothetical protein
MNKNIKNISNIMNSINDINNNSVFDSSIPMIVIKNSSNISNKRETSYINSFLQSLFLIDCINSCFN